MASDEKISPTAYGRVQLDNVEISVDRPLPQYNAGPVKAYDAVLRGEHNEPCFALICERSLSPRIAVMTTYAQMQNENAAQLVKWGPVQWPAASQERYALVYRKNLGNPLLKINDERGGLGLKHEAVVDIVIRPMVTLFEHLRDRDFIHGAIRVDNMFDGGTGKFEKVMLGDCLATPISYTQPVVYETIHRGMTDPIARGRGSASDDLYSFGVALAVLMRTKDPLRGMSDHEIIKYKIDAGSYAAITGKDRFTGSSLELLRGLLNDDPKERWKLEEIIAWLDGRRLSPKQAWRPKKASRPISIGSEKYFNTALLAMDLDKYQAESIPLIESGDMDQWLQRSLDDTMTTERYNQFMMPFRDAVKSPGFHDRLLSMAAFALDPHGPLRYRGAHVMGDGVGAALTEKMVNRQDIKTYSDILSQGMALNWVMSQDSGEMDTGGMLSRFDSCRSFLRHNKIGYGLERCLYYLNPDAPCMSDKLRDHAAHTPAELLRAFEALAKKGKAAPMFLDRHSAAFLSVKDRRCIDNQLFDLSAREEHKRVMAELKTFAILQQSTGIKSLPAIAATYQKRVDVLINRFHDRTVRQKLRQSVDQCITAGDIVKMAVLLSNNEVVNRDFQSFREAMQEYAALDFEYSKLEHDLKNRKNFGARSSQDISAIVCSVIAVLIVVAMSFMNFMK